MRAQLIELTADSRCLSRNGVSLNIAFTVFVMACVLSLLLMAGSRWVLALRTGKASGVG